MQTALRSVVPTAILLLASPALAEGDYPVLTRGQVVLANAQRFVVTQEPPPMATVAEAPPEPLATTAERPDPPSADAIWVAGHWIYGIAGFAWVAGHYVAPKAGHVFVPPRWASLGEQYLFFTGFYVPYGVYVRSHFNRYYYSGMPVQSARATSGPYWPIGAPTRTISAPTGARGAPMSATARDPYWPIGAPR